MVHRTLNCLMFIGLQQLCMLFRLVFVFFIEKKNAIYFDNMPVYVDRLV